MPTNHPAPCDEHALADSAHELQRAAGHVQQHAAASDQVPALGATLAHIEEALDRLSVGMLQMAKRGRRVERPTGPAGGRGRPAPTGTGAVLSPAGRRRFATRAARRLHLEPDVDASRARRQVGRRAGARRQFNPVPGPVVSRWPLAPAYDAGLL
jgi:hypothetical protein